MTDGEIMILHCDSRQQHPKVLVRDQHSNRFWLQSDYILDRLYGVALSRGLRRVEIWSLSRPNLLRFVAIMFLQIQMHVHRDRQYEKREERKHRRIQRSSW
jgi:hypothetical protein